MLENSTIEFISGSKNIENSPYKTYLSVLKEAFEQVSQGKGRERHVNDPSEPYEQQIACDVNRRLGGPSGALFQAIKKTYESQKFTDPNRAKHELLGAINYLVAGVILIQEKIDDQNRPSKTDSVREQISFVSTEDFNPERDQFSESTFRLSTPTSSTIFSI